MGVVRPVPLPGQLLVATPEITEEPFRRTVLLLLDHDGDGTLGLVVNRPTQLPLRHVLPGWHGEVVNPPVVFSGGPVSPDSALGLARLAPTDDGNGAGGRWAASRKVGGRQAGAPIGWKRLYEDVGLVDLDAPPEIVRDGVAAMRVFAGYAGWGPGQLDEELRRGSWLVVDAALSDPFDSAPTELWPAVLRRLGPPLAFAATYPDDPTAN